MVEVVVVVEVVEVVVEVVEVVVVVVVVVAVDLVESPNSESCGTPKETSCIYIIPVISGNNTCHIKIGRKEGRKCFI